CGDQDLFLAAADGQVTVRVQRADITGAEPAVLGEGFFSQLGPVAVTGEDADAFAQYLAIVSDLDCVARKRLAYSADLRLSRSIDGQRRGGFGEPITFHHQHANAVEEVAEPRPQR